MRKSREETARSRRRIVVTAADEFRRYGINGIGIADLMKEAGLTLGAFHKHFPSKDALVAEACTLALKSSIEAVTPLLFKPGCRSLRGAAEMYLAEPRGKEGSRRCPLSSLGGEIARADRKTRQAVTAQIERLLVLFETPLGRSKLAKDRAMVALSTIVGAMMLSQIVTDTKRSKAFLRSAKEVFGS